MQSFQLNLTLLIKTGPLSAPIGVEGTAFLPTKLSTNSSWPDLQVMFVSTHPGFDGGTLYKDFLQIEDDVIVIILIIIQGKLLNVITLGSR
jgi:hypothetical protein